MGPAGRRRATTPSIRVAPGGTIRTHIGSLFSQAGAPTGRHLRATPKTSLSVALLKIDLRVRDSHPQSARRASQVLLPLEYPPLLADEYTSVDCTVMPYRVFESLLDQVLQRGTPDVHEAEEAAQRLAGEVPMNRQLLDGPASLSTLHDSFGSLKERLPLSS